MEEPLMYFLCALMALLAGLFTFMKTQRDWRKQAAEWDQKLRAECRGVSAEDSEKEPAWLVSEKRFYRRQYWIRMMVGVCFLLMTLLFMGIWYCLIHKLAEEGVYCIAALLLLTFWMCAWAAADGVRTYVYLARKDANEVIAEEKERLRLEFERRAKKGKEKGVRDGKRSGHSE